VKLVDHGLRKGPVERQIAHPIIAIGIGYDAFHGHGRIVTGPRGCPAVVSLWDRYDESVRIKEDLLGVKPGSVFWCEGPVSTIGIYLAWLQVWHKDMPVVMDAVFTGFERDDPCGLDGIRAIE
jgi:hypothetical protein